MLTEKSRQRKHQERIILQTRPQLSKGLNLLERPENLPIFQVLTAAELEGRNSSAVWIDSRNEASTYALSNHGGPEILEKVRIGRAFTPLQHHSLIHQLEEFVNQDTELLVLPNLTYHYVEGQLADWERNELFEETWTQIREMQEEYDLKVLLSLYRREEMDCFIEAECGNKITVETTNEGLKYSSDGFKQMAYREGRTLQTTIPYWEDKTSRKVRLKAEVRN